MGPLGPTREERWQMAIPNHARAEVQRLVTRFVMERMLAGWPIKALADKAGVGTPSIHRFENGQIQNPTLGTMAALVAPMELRVDFVGERHLPFMDLDEYELEALVNGALLGWDSMEPGHTGERQLRSALRKLGKIKGANTDA